MADLRLDRQILEEMVSKKAPKPGLDEGWGSGPNKRI